MANISSTTSASTSKAGRHTSQHHFHGASFTRPNTIPKSLFAQSISLMKEGIQRNPYPHWDATTAAAGAGGSSNAARPACRHEVCKGYELTVCADCRQPAISPEMVAFEETMKKNIQQEDANNEDHMNMLHGCGVTVDWLLAFTFDHDCWDKTTWWVNRHIIKEATRETRCRYAHLDEMKEYSGPADVFASHPWGSKWGDVVLAVCHGASRRRIVWIDLFAVRQWPGKDLDLNFRAMIEKCKAMIVSVSPLPRLYNWDVGKSPESITAYLTSAEGIRAKKMTPFFRLWCNVEIAAGMNSNIPVLVKGGRASVSYSSSNSKDEE